MNREEKIEAYLSGALDSQEQQAFERAMAQDDSLLKEVQEYRKLNAALRAMGQEDIREQLRDLQRTHGPLADPPINLWHRLKFWVWAKRSLAVGLTVSVLILSLVLGFLFSAQCPDAELANTYFLPPVLIHDVAGANELTTAKRASLFYATNQLDSLTALGQSSASVFVRYYQAHALQQEGQYAAAEASYSGLIAQAEALREYSSFQNISRLRFNMILCQWANQQNISTCQQQLDLLEQEPDFQGTELQDAVNGLRAAFARPVFPGLCS